MNKIINLPQFQKRNAKHPLLKEGDRVKNILTILGKDSKFDEELYFSMIPRGIRINAEEILTQSTASTFEYFHTTSPYIWETGVPLMSL